MLETAALFAPLFNDAVEKHGVEPGQLTLHADRGGPSESQGHSPAARRSRASPNRTAGPIPRTTIRSPKAAFKTLKYQPQFPKRFGCIEDAKTFSRNFFDWYNRGHHHAGIGLMTPDQVHFEPSRTSL